MLEIRLKVDYQQIINTYRALFRTVIEAKYYRTVYLADKVDFAAWTEEISPNYFDNMGVENEELICQITQEDLDIIINNSDNLPTTIIKKLYYKAVDQAVKRQEEDITRQLKEMFTKLGGK